MIKVFLVEDEYVIREAIKRTVNWEQQDCELVGEAGDGEKAYQMMLLCKPDILITDIRMPFMDGLELAGLVRKNLPETRIVILSGYDDFSYAKEAISLGVAEYLLKPVSGAKLMETISRVKEGILMEREKPDYKEIYEAEHAEKQKYEKQSFYRNLIDGRLPMSKVLDMAEDLKINVLANVYAMVLLQIAFKEGDNTTQHPGAEKITDALQTMMDLLDPLPYAGCYEQAGGVLCLLLMADDAEELERRIDHQLTSLADIIAVDDQLLFYASVGSKVERLREIPDSFRIASRHFAARFMYNANKVFTCDPTSENEDVPQDAKEEFSLSGFDIAKIDRPIIFHFLRSGLESDASAFVKSCFAGMSINNLNSQLVRQYIVMDTYLKTASFLQEEGLGNEEIEEAIGQFHDVKQIATLENTTQYLETLLRKAIEVRDRISSTRYGSLIAQTKQYIYKHYTESDLSLGMAASEVGVSSNHLSRLFSQNTGTTFVEFLTQVRMEKARWLLRDTSLPGSEIAQKTGYQDAHYFYYLFKKTQGQTPTQYRTEAQRKGDGSV